jgi:hypothetical protein
MRGSFHPEFARDVLQFESGYREISESLSTRFQDEIDAAIDAIQTSPTRAGHYLSLGSGIVRDFRRRNLRSFPFFVLYGMTDDMLIFGSVIPSRSDPLTWLARFEK